MRKLVNDGITSIQANKQDFGLTTKQLTQPTKRGITKKQLSQPQPPIKKK